MLVVACALLSILHYLRPIYLFFFYLLDAGVTRGKHIQMKENGARVSNTSSILGSQGTTNNSSMLAPSRSVLVIFGL